MPLSIPYSLWVCFIGPTLCVLSLLTLLRVHCSVAAASAASTTKTTVLASTRSVGHKGKVPSTAQASFVAPNASVIGDVKVRSSACCCSEQPLWLDLFAAWRLDPVLRFFFVVRDVPWCQTCLAPFMVVPGEEVQRANEEGGVRRLAARREAGHWAILRWSCIALKEPKGIPLRGTWRNALALLCLNRSGFSLGCSSSTLLDKKFAGNFHHGIFQLFSAAKHGLNLFLGGTKIVFGPQYTKGSNLAGLDRIYLCHRRP